MKKENDIYQIGLKNYYLTMFSGAVLSWVRKERKKHGEDNLLDNLENMAMTIQHVSKHYKKIALIFTDKKQTKKNNDENNN